MIDMKDSFAKLHPLVSFLFFAAVLTFTMLLTQPVCLGITVACAWANAVYLNGKKAALLSLRLLLPTAVFIVLINALFNHRGATVLFYLPWDNPLTLESVLYGCVTAAMLSAAILWFSVLNTVLTSDKVVYLLGRVAPSLGLVLAMALRFIPRFFAVFRQTKAAQAQLCAEKPSVRRRFQAAVRVFSAVVSRSMENAVDTADSMKSRGYGMTGRTAFSLYRFCRRDTAALTATLAATLLLTVLLIGGSVRFRYFPSVRGSMTGGFTIAFYIVYAALLLLPLCLSVGEGVKWKRLRSGI